MRINIDSTQKVDGRHLRGFRKIQRAVLKALSGGLDAIADMEQAGGGKKKVVKETVKAGDIKALVAAFKDAVAGERAVLGMDGGGSLVGNEELCLRWVIDNSAGPGGNAGD